MASGYRARTATAPFAARLPTSPPARSSSSKSSQANPGLLDRHGRGRHEPCPRGSVAHAALRHYSGSVPGKTKTIVLVDARNVLRSQWPNLPEEELVERCRAWAEREGLRAVV